MGDGRSTRAYQRMAHQYLTPRPGATCALCGEPIEYGRGKWHPRGPSLDHITPLNKGGRLLDPANMQLAHYGCNSARGDKTLAEWFAARKAETTSDW
jgi:5-methylcytosine-specific restriction endonuclease McrA